MMTKVPSIAARPSGRRRTSAIRRSSVRATRPSRRACLRRTRPCTFMADVPESSSGAVAATTLVTPSTAPVRGDDASAVTTIADGAVAWEDGVITYAGPSEGLPGAERFEGCTIAPGFVDAHTHLPFAGWRADEYEARLRGVSYRELPGEGGVHRSARTLPEASDADVLSFCLPLVQEMADHGTTTLELKTGYGLSVEAELRQARPAPPLAGGGPPPRTPA